MTDDELLSRYRVLNESFSTPLIFHLGIDAGFFTEFSYMIHAMLFCLENHLQFNLYSKDANFAYSKGWRDYFEPFCPEIEDDFHHKWNVHRIPCWRNMLSASFQQKSPKPFIWKCKNEYKAYVCRKYCKRLYGKNCRTTHDVLFVQRKRYLIPDLHIDGDYIAAYQTLARTVWRLNPTTKVACENLLNTLQIPSPYMGIHIRGGDKITETSLVSPLVYAQILKQQSSFNNVFLITDDYSNYTALCNQVEDFHWYTLCEPEEKGYVHTQFCSQQKEKKHLQMIRFLSQVEGAMHSSYFIGSITCGLSLFLHKWFWPKNYTIDCKHTEFPDISCAPIKIRSKIAEDFRVNRGLI